MSYEDDVENLNKLRRDRLDLLEIKLNIEREISERKRLIEQGMAHLQGRLQFVIWRYSDLNFHISVLNQEISRASSIVHEQIMKQHAERKAQRAIDRSGAKS